jgi:ABC-type multidrug transport system ATPase subunit
LRQTIWNLIGKRCTDGATVILVTHDVAEAERTLDRVAILDRGRIVAGGTPAELKAKLAHRTRIEIVVAEGAATKASELAGVISGDARVRDRHISAWVPADDAIRNLDKVMDAAEPGSLEDIRLVTPTLEDVYLEVGGRSITEADNR